MCVSMCVYVYVCKLSLCMDGWTRRPRCCICGESPITITTSTKTTQSADVQKKLIGMGSNSTWPIFTQLCLQWTKLLAALTPSGWDSEKPLRRVSASSSHTAWVVSGTSTLVCQGGLNRLIKKWQNAYTKKRRHPNRLNTNHYKQLQSKIHLGKSTGLMLTPFCPQIPVRRMTVSQQPKRTSGLT